VVRLRFAYMVDGAHIQSPSKAGNHDVLRCYTPRSTRAARSYALVLRAAYTTTCYTDLLT
jgi:hypothetical protein